jgi:hypothetical protein
MTLLQVEGNTDWLSPHQSNVWRSKGMDNEVGNELLQELFSALETMDTQSAAILQFLKDKGMASDGELAPYLEQAGNASNVRWRAVRVRVSSLLSSAAKKMDESVARKAEETAQKTVAAELEAEKPRRGRRKETAQKGPEGQAEKSQPEKSQADKSQETQAGRSMAGSQPAAMNETERQESAENKPADTKQEPNKPFAKTESGKPETAKSGQSNSQGEQRDSSQSEKKIA